MRNVAYPLDRSRRRSRLAALNRAASAVFVVSMLVTVSAAQATPTRVAAARGALLRYGHSMQTKNWKAACALMTASARKRVVADARTYKHTKVHNCPAAYAATFRISKNMVGEPITPAWIKALKTTRVVVHGDTATAMGYTMFLTRGEWLVAT